MLYRYATTTDGALKLKAKIYTKDEHGISEGDIDRDALGIVVALARKGYEAYIVGGAIRDLLLNRHPKDFDVSTDARPRQIKAVFRHARIIGRRFRLVHVYCSRSRYVEVSTFRSHSPETGGNNIFGTLGEDAFRRDFSMNALFYCPRRNQIIDYVEGFRDIKRKMVRSLISTGRSFREDPVRMVRAVKYAAALDLRLHPAIRTAIHRLGGLVQQCSSERLTEEIFKILQSGHSAAIIGLASRTGLSNVLLPFLRPKGGRRINPDDPVLFRLKKLDRIVEAGKSVSRGQMLHALVSEAVPGEPQWRIEPLAAVVRILRERLSPLSPSNKDLLVLARSYRIREKTG